jgi:hypothetical protein
MVVSMEAEVSPNNRQLIERQGAGSESDDDFAAVNPVAPSR